MSPRLVAALIVCAVGLAMGPAAARTSSVTPTFRSYVAPVSVVEYGAEPSIGVNPRTGAVMFQANVTTLRVDAFDAAGTGTARWTDVTPRVGVDFGTFDPVMETDTATGRTWVSHLQLACSRMAYTDDDGRSWTAVPVGCAPGSVWDHQTMGAGPFPAGATGASFPSAVYYCANNVVVMSCGVSRDGGTTFEPARPVGGGTSLGACGVGWGMHVARDGTVYIPPFFCDPTSGYGGMGVHITDDAGLTWRSHLVPGGTNGTAATAGVTTDAAGTAYLVWGSATGKAEVAVSRDKGRTWTRPYDVGARFGIVNVKFPTAVGGDEGRAAVAFLGSPKPGNDQLETYDGEWHLYVAHTYDGGRTWRTVDATPQDPVQVGAICVTGIACASSRNLLDFIDMAVDPRGHVLVAIADGCTRPTCDTSARESQPTIVRQTGGRGLLRRHDR